MPTYKCKMCGGTLEFNDKDSLVTCKYCGVKQALPKLDYEEKLSNFNKVSQSKNNNELDNNISIHSNKSRIFLLLIFIIIVFILVYLFRDYSNYYDISSNESKSTIINNDNNDNYDNNLLDDKSNSSADLNDDIKWLYKVKLAYNMRLRSNPVQSEDTFICVTNAGTIYEVYEVLNDSHFTWYRVGNNEWIGDDSQCVEILDDNDNSTYLYKIVLDNDTYLYSDINFDSSNRLRELLKGYELYVYEEIYGINNNLILRVGDNLFIEVNN